MTDTGLIFGEHVRTEKIKKHRHSEDRRKPNQPMRQAFLLFFLFVATAILTLRLSTLQIVKGNYYRKLADSNRIRTSVLHAPRGIMADRNGTPLVINIPGFRKIEKTKTSFLDKESAMQMIASGAKNIEVDSLRKYIYRDVFAHIIGYVGQISESQLKNPDFSTYAQTDVLGKTGIEFEYQDILRGEDGKELIEVDSSGKSLRTLGRT